MRISRTISSLHPEKCHMIAKGFFGNVKGEVKYCNYHAIEFNTGYLIVVNNKTVGSASDFLHACDTLLHEIGVVKTTCV